MVSKRAYKNTLKKHLKKIPKIIEKLSPNRGELRENWTLEPLKSPLGGPMDPRDLPREPRWSILAILGSLRAPFLKNFDDFLDDCLWNLDLLVPSWLVLQPPIYIRKNAIIPPCFSLLEQGIFGGRVQKTHSQ